MRKYEINEKSVKKQLNIAKTIKKYKKKAKAIIIIKQNENLSDVC